MLDFTHARTAGRPKKLSATIVGAATLLVGSYVSCHAQTGSVHFSVVKAGFIVSTGSGTGSLNYQGRTYRLSVSTVGYGTIGVTGGETLRLGRATPIALAALSEAYETWLPAYMSRRQGTNP